MKKTHLRTTDRLTHVRQPGFRDLGRFKNLQQHEATNTTMRIAWFLSVICFSSAGAFVPLSCPNARIDHVTLFMTESQGREMSRRGLVHFFGIGAWWFAIQQGSWAAESSLPSEAAASGSNPFESSSVQVSDAIKTLDMSLPSYGEIKAPTASVENVEGLTVPYNPRTGAGQPQGRFRKDEEESEPKAPRPAIPGLWQRHS
jgi:hypothetical protein